MAVDAHIVDLFGPAPEGIDLSENYAQNADAANIALISIALLAVVLRFGARFVQKAGLKADDYFALAALFLSVATCVLSGEIIRLGAGKHVWALTADQVVNMTRMLFVLAFVYNAAAWTLKASIVFLYVRLFPLNDTLFRVGIYSMAVIGTGICIASMIVLVVACQPISYFWGRFDTATPMTTSDSAPKCIDIGIMFITLASINVSLDFFLLAIPMPRILKLQMTARKKIVVITSLLLGIFVCVAGLMRIYYIVLFNHALDYSFRLAPVCMWLSLEPAIGIVTSCLPNMLPLYYWCCERVGILREGGNGDFSLTQRTHHHHHTHKQISSTGTRSKSHMYYGDGGDLAAPRVPNSQYAHHMHDKNHNVMLRPKEDDEICLTTMATAARNMSDESVEVFGNGIMVRSEVTQTVESGGELKRVTSL